MKHKAHLSKGIMSGIYHDGKLIISSGPKHNISNRMILDVKKVKDTLFLTEIHGEVFDEKCNLYFPTYKLKMKIGRRT